MQMFFCCSISYWIWTPHSTGSTRWHAMLMFLHSENLPYVYRDPQFPHQMVQLFGFYLLLIANLHFPPVAFTLFLLLLYFFFLTVFLKLNCVFFHSSKTVILYFKKNLIYHSHLTFKHFPPLSFALHLLTRFFLLNIWSEYILIF